MMTDAELDQYAFNWVRWCATRRYYIKPGGSNILAQFMPHKVRKPPDAALEPEMIHFHLALHALADMEKYKTHAACFAFFYIDQAKHVKQKAKELSICTKTYYNQARSFVRMAISMGESLRNTGANISLRSPELAGD